MNKLGIFAVILIAVALGSCVTSTQPPLKNEINTSGNVDLVKLSDESELSIQDINPDIDPGRRKSSSSSLSINKQIVDINNNGRLDEGEKVNITYGASDTKGIRNIRLLLDGYVISAQQKEGSYSVTTDPLSIGEHRAMIVAINSEKVQSLQDLKIIVDGEAPSFYFPRWRFNLREGEQFEIVISAVNPPGNPKAKALLIVKPPGHGISVMESWCKGLAGMCTGEYELDPGDNVRSISLKMHADKAGVYKIDAQIYYQFENSNNSGIPRYQTIVVVVKP